MPVAYDKADLSGRSLEISSAWLGVEIAVVGSQNQPPLHAVSGAVEVAILTVSAPTSAREHLPAALERE